MINLADETDLRRRAERRVAAKAGFHVHALIYVVVNLGLIAMNLIGSPGYPWSAWPLFGWGIGLAANGIAVYAPRPRWREDAVRREMERLR